MRHVITAALLLCLLFLASPAMADLGAPFFVDFSKAANRALEDDGIANNGKGGWTDEGINDFFVYPPLTVGESIWRGTPFRLLDPKQNAGRAVIMLAGSTRCQDLSKSVTAEVPGVKGKFVYFMHTSAGRPALQPGNVVATYTLTYSDKSTASLSVRNGHEIQQWYVGQWWDNEGTLRYPIFMGRNTYSGRWNQWIGVWATQWTNPQPEKAITSITYESAGADVAAIFATTIADTDYAALRDTKENKIGRPGDVPEGFFDAKLDGERLAIFAAMKAEKLVQGVRRVEVIRPDIIAVTIDQALGEIASGQGEKTAAAYQVPDSFTVSSEQDEVFGKTGAKPVKVSRQSQKIDTRAIGPFLATPIFWHTYYLHLASPLKLGMMYTIAAKNIETPFTSSMTLKFDPASVITPVIKVNQVGYSAIAKRRYAYLGWWAADGGAVDYASFRKFDVIDEASGKTVLSGDITLRNADDKISGEQVSELNLAALGEGQYHILVPGLGRSFTFAVGGDSARELYFNTMRAFLHQRCGVELTSEVTQWPHPACHVQVYENKHLVENNPPHKEGEAIRSYYGGYHDAGDTDVFASHLPATSQTLAIYEQFQSAFGDKDLTLPESGHGVPDVLSEALWALKFCGDNQQEDGGILFGRANDCDSLRQVPAQDQLPFGLFRAKSVSSSAFAATAAQLSRLLRRYDAKRADELLAKAEKAYAWAKSHQPAADSKDPGESYWKITLGWAAAELFDTTGKEEYNEDFRTIYLAKGMQGDWKLGTRGNLYLWPYIITKQPKVDAVIQERVRKAFLESADWAVKSTEEPAYRMGRGAKEGGWGNSVGGGIYGDTLIRAYVLTKDQKYLDAASLNADFQLGANPLSLCFITGMGTRFPMSPEITENLRAGYGKTVKGISVYGLGGKGMSGYPKTVPIWRCYEDNRVSAFWSEFTITETIGPAASLYAGLWAVKQGAAKSR